MADGLSAGKCKNEAVMTDRDVTVQKVKRRFLLGLRRSGSTLKWVGIAISEGVILGVIGTAFYYCIAIATGLRESHPEFLLLLPFGAMLILFVYHLTKRDHPGGTNLVLSAIREGKNIPLRMTPLIFFSTVFSHLSGASVGREGAALQLGGSVGNFMAKVYHQRGTDKKIMVLSGMGAAFSALLGTPLAGAVFALEITSVGVMYYPALLPSVIASFTAHRIALFLKEPAPSYRIGPVPSFGFLNGVRIGILGLAAGLAASLFVLMLRKTEKYTAEKLTNRYLRAFLLGVLLLGLTILISFLEGETANYNGAGLSMIVRALKGDSPWYAFLLKILFTALSIAAGYKGGEIVPSFFIGATLGSAVGPLLGLPAGLSAAAGMGAVFCGVTNCPLTGLLFLFELFGFRAMPYFIVPIAVSYVVSSYYSLYRTQHFHFPKFEGDDASKEGGR